MVDRSIEMPPMKGQSGFAAKLGGKLAAATEAHKNDETTFSSFGELPPGIESGIAQLVECKFDQYKPDVGTKELVGQYYCRLAGVVVHPATHSYKIAPDAPLQTDRVAGKQFSQLVPLCDTPSSKGKRKTFDDHIAFLLNEWRKLGVDTKGLTAESYESTAEALKAAGPFFKFRTWKGEASAEFPNPRVNVQWEGACDPPEETSDDGIQDNTGASPPPPAAPPAKPAPAAAPKPPVAAPKPAPVKPAPAPKPAAKAPPAPPPPPTPPTQEDDGDAIPFDELDGLAELADPPTSDGDAGEKLQVYAHKAGIPQADVEAANSWADIVAQIKATQPEGGTTEPEGETAPDAEWEPKVGEVHFYQPPGKPKAIECDVLSVDPVKKTVNLKNMDDKKTLYKLIPWGSLTGS